MSKGAKRLSEAGNRTKLVIAVAVDYLCTLSAIAVAYWIRLATLDFDQLWLIYFLVPLATVLIFRVVGVYGVVLRYCELEDFAPLLCGITFSSLFLLAVSFLLGPDPNPRSIFVIFGLILAILTITTRHVWKTFVSSEVNGAGVPVAVYGAGRMGRQVVQL